MAINKKIASRMRRLRKAKGITQEQAAHDADLDYSYYNQIENAKRNPSIEALERIAKKALGVSLSDLVG